MCYWIENLNVKTTKTVLQAQHKHPPKLSDFCFTEAQFTLKFMCDLREPRGPEATMKENKVEGLTGVDFMNFHKATPIPASVQV